MRGSCHCCISDRGARFVLRAPRRLRQSMRPRLHRMHAKRHSEHPVSGGEKCGAPVTAVFPIAEHDLCSALLGDFDSRCDQDFIECMPSAIASTPSPAGKNAGFLSLLYFSLAERNLALGETLFKRTNLESPDGQPSRRLEQSDTTRPPR